MGRNILLIGIGETGCSVAEDLSRFMSQNHIHSVSLAVDTDRRTQPSVTSAFFVPMAEDSGLCSVVDAVGAEYLKEWFPCDWEGDRSGFLKGLEMNKGANQWRMKALLSFATFLANEKAVSRLRHKLETFVGESDRDADVEIYTVASLAGGTGAGLFMPVTLYIKKLLRELGAGETVSTAMLACPDIYETALSPEQRIKADANAYAALRELHAVNLVSRGYGRECAEDKHSPVEFSLNLKGEQMAELLFDADMEDFGRPEAAPFDKVYLFERVPGVHSIGAHQSMITDTLETLCSEAADAPASKNSTSNLKMIDDVYGAISQTKVRYPVDSIVTYMAKQKLFGDVDGDWLHLHRRVMREFYRRRSEARAYGYVFAENADTYSETVVAVANDLIAEQGNDLAVLGRVVNDATLSTVPEGLFDSGFADTLCDILDEKFMGNFLEETGTICSGRMTAPDKVSKLAMVNNAERKKKLVAAASRLRKLFSDLYCDTADGLDGGVAELESELMRDDDSAPASVVANLIKKDGAFLHPAYALVRLCRVHEEIKAKVAKPLVWDEQLVKSGLVGVLDEEVLAVEAAEKRNCTYAKRGIVRFWNVLEGNESCIGGSEKDEALFLADANCIVEKVTKEIRSNVYAKVLGILEKLIEGYRAFFDGVERMVEELSGDLKLALIADAQDCGRVVNVASSEEDKKTAYRSYAADILHDGETYATADKRIGSCAFEFVVKNGADAPRKLFRDAVSDIENTVKNDILKSDFYRLHMNRNIIEILSAPDGKIVADVSNVTRELRIRRALKARNAPIRLRMPEDGRDFHTVTTVSKVLLSENMRAYAENQTGTADPNALIEPLLSIAGEYQGDAEYRTDLSENSLCVVREMRNIQLHFVDALNERGENPTIYKNYCRALMSMVEQSTQMWNPYLFRTVADFTCGLPYIAPTMQKAHDGQVASALLYALLYEEIVADVEDTNGDRIFCYMEKDEKKPILFGEDTILEENPEKLLRWMATQPELVKKWARVYDSIADDERKALRHGSEATGMLSRQISRGRLISVLRDKLLKVAYFFLRQRNAPALAERLLLVGYETLIGHCSRCLGEWGLAFDEVYSAQRAQFIETFVDSGMAEDLDDFREFVAWMNACGIFETFRFSDRSPYEIPEEILAKFETQAE